MVFAGRRNFLADEFALCLGLDDFLLRRHGPGREHTYKGVKKNQRGPDFLPPVRPNADNTAKWVDWKGPIQEAGDHFGNTGGHTKRDVQQTIEVLAAPTG